jgi:hypothetical protein
MLTVENRRGRLIEVVAKSPMAMAEIEQGNVRMTEILAAQKERAVLCSDYAKVRVFPAQQIKRLSDIFAKHAPRIERSGILVAPDSDVALIQIERMITLAGDPMRCAFRDARELFTWLSDFLDPGERVRLRMFLRSSSP